jgi:hypothetical protein
MGRVCENLCYNEARVSPVTVPLSFACWSRRRPVASEIVSRQSCRRLQKGPERWGCVMFVVTIEINKPTVPVGQ